MMARITRMCLLLLTMALHINAQVNYLPNGGFEQYSRCPYYLNQIKFATGWTAIDTINHPPADSFGTPCAPDYCNTCAGANITTGVPSNSYFYHYPHTGNGMAQMIMYSDESNPTFPYKRDYLQGKLSKPLIVGTSYCVTFYALLEPLSQYAINDIGAYFDNGIIDTTQDCGGVQTAYTPQVKSLNIINDTLNWTKIEGSFTATANQNYITLGNFYDKTHTGHINSISGVTTGYSFYLIDDISVVESNTPAYAGGTKYKAKHDSVFIGRNEIAPDCAWYRNGVLIDTVHAGFWVKDTVPTTYVVKQSICGNVKYDTAHIVIVPEGVASVGNESVYRIYPNPAQHEVTIQAPNNTSTASMAIYDLSGRVMMRQQVLFVNGEVHIPLSLPGSVYVVELVDKDGGKNIQRLSVL